jgi:hypothetical protein
MNKRAGRVAIATALAALGAVNWVSVAGECAEDDDGGNTNDGSSGTTSGSGQT